MLTTRNTMTKTSVEACVRSVGPECVVVKRWGDAGR